MRMYDLIYKKKNGLRLSTDEIRFIVDGYTHDQIPDYQMSSFLMAVCWRGMDMQETTDLTLAMRDSGEKLDLSAIEGVTVDKHSTGGVGDKTSLILGPMVASLGVPVAKMSGRGLGHTGGTIDKLESFPGFSTSISGDKFFELVNRNKIAIMGQTADLAPADKKMYALRDVTATVDNLPLIASSIMSKKLASGADSIVLDVKMGSGAFMKDYDGAMNLARTMVDIGTLAGKKTYALITDMNQPLGHNVGNALEVIEAIETLKGNGPKDLLQDCVGLGSLMLMGAGITDDMITGHRMLVKTLEDGSALKKFEQFVEAQGGDISYIHDISKFRLGEIQQDVISPYEGYLTKIQTDEIGMCSLILGGGRETKESSIDLGVGIILSKKLGDFVKKGEPLCKMYANDARKLKEASERYINALTFSDTCDCTHKPAYAYLTSKETVII